MIFSKKKIEGCGCGIKTCAHNSAIDVVKRIHPQLLREMGGYEVPDKTTRADFYLKILAGLLALEYGHQEFDERVEVMRVLSSIVLNAQVIAVNEPIQQDRGFKWHGEY